MGDKKMEMTREAIEYFKFIRKILCDDHLKICPKNSIAYQATLKEKEFYDMAIKALEQEPCDDCVSRKAVLEMAKSYNTDGFDMYTPLVVDVEDIEELPPVTPQPCEDAISRQALLNATVHKNSIWNKITDSKGENLETIISKLPLVTPQPYKGRK